MLTLYRDYSPYATYLKLHYGTITKDNNPKSSIAPTLRNRSTKAVITKKTANSRHKEKLADKLL
jgi:hypothetical protein